MHRQVLRITSSGLQKHLRAGARATQLFCWPHNLQAPMHMFCEAALLWKISTALVCVTGALSTQCCVSNRQCAMYLSTKVTAWLGKSTWRQGSERNRCLHPTHQAHTSRVIGCGSGPVGQRGPGRRSAG